MHTCILEIYANWQNSELRDVLKEKLNDDESWIKYVGSNIANRFERSAAKLSISLLVPLPPRCRYAPAPHPPPHAHIPPSPLLGLWTSCC